ncbi:MAG: radical SAM family heme chaperone HemW [Marinifilaceae bacterium]
MSVYIHIPFCASKCTYCAFYSVASAALMERYTRAVLQEMEWRKDYLPGRVAHKSLYLGGGTPSVLRDDLFEELLRAVMDTFTFTADAERTLEVNPEDVTAERVAMWKRLGFNRVSMGVQSFNDNVLRRVKRRHSGEGALRALQILREAGIKLVSGDLIVGLPESSEEILEQDVKQLIAQGVGHVSVYMLSVDERTEMEMQVKRGLFTPLDDDELTARFEKVCQWLTDAGYEHYEISNFALPGCRAVHNSAYWRGDTYLGLGPAAHSYNEQGRHWGIASVKRYVEEIEAGNLPIEEEVLTAADRYNERVMTGLRMRDGVTNAEMEALDKDAWHASYNYRKKCVEAGYATMSVSGFALTPKGWLLSDKIFSELFC